MGNKNFIEYVLGNLGWYLYVKFSWNKNLEIGELLNPKNLSGEQIRDNLGYFLTYGHETLSGEKHEAKINVSYAVPNIDVNKTLEVFGKQLEKHNYSPQVLEETVELLRPILIYLNG